MDDHYAKMEKKWQGTLSKVLGAFIDDIVTYSDTAERHLEHLKAVMDLLQDIT